jgi:hypothetical protein
MLPPLMRWGLVFLYCPIDLDEDDKRRLVMLAARAYFEDAGVVPFEWEHLRGEVRASAEAVAMGAITGQPFEAEVHRPQGSAILKFLVTEKQLQAAHLLGGPGVVAEA